MLLALRFQDPHYCPLTAPLPPAAKPVSPMTATEYLATLEPADYVLQRVEGSQWLIDPAPVEPPASILKPEHPEWIEITGAWSRNCWYSEKVGQRFKVVEASKVAPSLQVEIGGGRMGFVLEEDCKPAEAPKAADADGWIPHDGGECPVAKGVKVEVKTNSGKTAIGHAGNWVWGRGCMWYIVSYRIVGGA